MILTLKNLSTFQCFQNMFYQDSIELLKISLGSFCTTRLKQFIFFNQESVIRYVQEPFLSENLDSKEIMIILWYQAQNLLQG